MSQYLSEDIKQPIVHSPPGSPRNVYLLKAPTGSGKTTFFIKDLVPEARRRRQQVLLIVNRNVLTEQLINIYLKELGIPPGAIEFPQAGIYPLGDLVVCSYQYMAQRLQDTDTPTLKSGLLKPKSTPLWFVTSATTSLQIQCSPQTRLPSLISLGSLLSLSASTPQLL